MEGVARNALPRVVPTARPVKAPSRFVSVYERASGTPRVAEAITSGLGETLAPRMEAVRLKGALLASELRRASTVTSQTPGWGLVVVRLVDVPVVQAVVGRV